MTNFVSGKIYCAKKDRPVITPPRPRIIQPVAIVLKFPNFVPTQLKK